MVASEIQGEQHEVTDMVVVGHTQPHSARIWVRAQRPGRFEIAWRRRGGTGHEACAGFSIAPDNERDNTHVVILGRGGLGDAELSPNTRYDVRITRAEEGVLLGRASFLTPPLSPLELDRFCFLVASCHQPFDDQGRVLPGAREMLRAARRLVEERDVHFLLLVGDQMYTDYPPDLSLLDSDHFASVAPPGRQSLSGCTAEEVRSLLHARYRRFWAMPEWQALVSRVACYPMWDDHEIIDNWGSASGHDAEHWRALLEGACRSYHDYQASWVLDTPAPNAGFDFAFGHGPIAVYALDIRSNRTPGDNGRLYSPEQRSSLEAFLRQHADKEALFLVFSVPVVHLPRYAAKIASRLGPTNEDFSDRWSTGGHVRDRDQLLAILRAHQRRHPQQRVVLVSGDIHIGCAHEICWKREGSCFQQIVSSGLTHGVGSLVGQLSRWSILANKELQTECGQLSARVHRLPGEDGHGHNPYVGRNCGLVELTRPAPGEPMQVRLEIHGHEGPEPRCVFRSRWF